MKGYYWNEWEKGIWKVIIEEKGNIILNKEVKSWGEASYIMIDEYPNTEWKELKERE